jgi:hypothetical protein
LVSNRLVTLLYFARHSEKLSLLGWSLNLTLFLKKESEALEWVARSCTRLRSLDIGKHSGWLLNFILSGVLKDCHFAWVQAQFDLVLEKRAGSRVS